MGKHGKQKGEVRMRKVKKPITKRWWFWAIVVLLVAGIVGSIGGDDSTADAPESSPVVEDTAEPEDTAQPDATDDAQPSIEPEETTGLDVQEYATDIVVASKMTLDRFISDYKVSLATQNWTIAKFDENDAVIAMTDVTLKSGYVKTAIVVSTPIFDGSKMTGTTPHYVDVGDEVFVDDGYCDEVFSIISDLLNGSA